MQDPSYDIVVIGGGAQATAFLSAIYHFITVNNKYLHIKIGIVDKKENFGCGNVYQDDYPWILMNTPTTDLSVVKNKPNDFSDWVKCNLDHLLLCNHDQQFVPRKVFGQYLKDRFYFFRAELIKKNIFIDAIDDFALDIIDVNETNEDIKVSLKSGNMINSKYIVFATGPNNPQDHYNLNGLSNYIHNPLPASQNISQIPKSMNVTIIGSNLTAIDIAVTLKHLGHQGNIYMASRNGKLPEVKGNFLKSYPPKNALYANYQNISKEKGTALTLSDLLRLVRKELISHGFHWRDYFFNKKSQPECIQDFQLRVEEARNGPTPFNIILGMIPEIAKTWRLVSLEQLDLFMSKYYRYVHQKHGAIPLVNAEKILTLLQSGQLILKGNLNNIVYHNNIYSILFEDNEKINCNYVINATGPKRSICDDLSKLPYTTPCAKGFIKEISIGGTIIDTNTGMILKSNGKFERKYRAIGHNAEGSHPFINNFAWILESSYEVTESLLIEVSNGK